MKKLVLIVAAILLNFSFSYAQTSTVTVTGTWIHPTSGAPATGVRMERSTDGTTWTTACSVGPTVTTCSDTPQSVGPVYKYRVVRFNDVGPSAPSGIFSVATAVPDPATNVNGSCTIQGNTSTGVNLNCKITMGQ